MANEAQVKQLLDGVAGWNAWRNGHKERPDFVRAELNKAKMIGANLSGGDLHGAELNDADLSHADLSGSNLVEANLINSKLAGANLRGANLLGANLGGADLSDADLKSSNMTGTYLVGANLSGSRLMDAKIIKAHLRDARLTGALAMRADFRESYLNGAYLSGANLNEAQMVHSNLSEADLTGANLSQTNLEGANLRGARLRETVLRGTNTDGADVTNAILLETIFANVDLSNAVGLGDCKHFGPSTLDLRTRARSKSLPLAFLRGIGLPESVIAAGVSRYYSCFISYSSVDQEFANRIYADLQEKTVRCWFAPHDLPIGGKILDETYAAIRLHDRVLLVLSEDSIRSDWVEDEVTRAFEEERKRGQVVLFPIRLDDTVMTANEAWAEKLRARNIGDFRNWRNLAAYGKSFERLLGDLTFGR
jgi:uncharacterized protein YjbI with pentapeptide repeats